MPSGTHGLSPRWQLGCPTDDGDRKRCNFNCSATALQALGYRPYGTRIGMSGHHAYGSKTQSKGYELAL
jgi:hypothetical protein